TLAIDDNRYQDNDSLDHVSGSGRFSWEWASGGHWSGDLAADYDRALVNFANSRVFAKDLLDQQRYHGTLRYPVGPSLRLFAGGRHTEGTHSLDARKIDDYQTDVGLGGLRIETATGSKLDAQYSYTKARFPDGATLAGVPFDRDYDQRDESLRWQHEFSP